MRLASWMCALGTAALAFGCGGSDGTAGETSSSSSSSGSETELHDQPSREEIAEVLAEQAAHIRECGSGTGETVRVEIVFEGVSGTAVEINYPEDIARTTKICIESNLVHASVHPFKQDRFTVTYPFKLRENGGTPAKVESDDDDDQD